VSATVDERSAPVDVTAPETEVDRKSLALLALGHAVTDSYGHSFLSPMFPLLATKLGLSLALVGAFPMVMGLSASLGQPVLGYVSDRWSRIPMVAWGPAMAALCLGLVGIAPNYGTLLVCLFLTGLGIGAFHPQGALLAKQAARGRGFAMASFTVGGNVGFGLAPLLGALYLRFLGMERLYWAAIPGLLFAAFMGRAFAARLPRREAAAAPRQAPVGTTQHWPLALLTATVAMRAALQVGMVTFLPFYMIERGIGRGHEEAKGFVVSAFLLANAFAGPIGGHLCDRLGRKRVMFWTFAIAPWLLAVSFWLPGYACIAGLVFGGFILAMPHPANVVMAQELMPHRAGIAASLITGLAWGIATMVAMPLGALAEHTSVTAVLIGLSLFTFLGTLLVLPIPDPADAR
jgi:FSR family fosmidomycin resistance protein-like MFS transporter